MDTRDFNSLKPNPMNPRTLSDHDHKSLKVSLDELGDLGVIVYNVELDRLVGGHQRYKILQELPGDKKIVLTQKFDPAMPDGTTALGYITNNNKWYAYREVRWDEARDLAANVAANRISGEWNLEQLADVNQIIKDLDQDLLKITGQTDAELSKLNQLGNEPEQPSESGESMSFKLDQQQAEVVDEALGNILATHTFDLSGNSDRRGHALYQLSREYLDRLHGMTEQPPVGE